MRFDHCAAAIGIDAIRWNIRNNLASSSRSSGSEGRRVVIARVTINGAARCVTSVGSGADAPNCRKPRACGFFQTNQVRRMNSATEASTYKTQQLTYWNRLVCERAVGGVLKRLAA